ncbi:Peroxide stress-activated histidine kinase mak1 [Neolecta irregularis DAH-3]|uniref:histidine kinase n=1 Tax=Neolecta irregularis (strain DAH-3) TaxID=1198029 RepID=A0A1U7LSD7_NEOID|nr:Peroxide stress-activated histidine kinase mak1 [Neolecta irregularis DAH-3]|eukprot:OLL25539.1 Peroxide stress-activated histidine kinase mak1 [Neolecta irregularis DAH-3]
MVDAIPVHVYTASPLTGHITWANARCLSYRGATPQEFLASSAEPIHPDDYDTYTAHWTAAIRKGETFSRAVRLRRFDHQYRWFLTKAVPLRDHKGATVQYFGTSIDIHDQKIAEQNAAKQAEIQASELKYRSLAEACPQIVFAATSSRGITYTNTHWTRYSGQSFEEAIGLGFLGRVHPSDRGKCLLPSGSENGPFSMELLLQSSPGEFRWFLVTRICVERHDDGEGDLWFGTCSDINEHKLVEQKLKEANEAIQKSMESKSRFLSNMSHEIRTPLSGIAGMATFLLDTQLTVEQLDYAHTIQHSAGALMAVINDILDLSKVEAGMMRIEYSALLVRGMIDDAHEVLSTIAMAKNLDLNYVVEENVPNLVYGDGFRLRQVLLNIIGNAIKFTAHGEVFTRCFVKKESPVEPGYVKLSFTIVDTGPDKQVMFKPFSQVDASSTRAHGGSGLGLVISKRLVELHGGTMQCSSVKGFGSTFAFCAKFKLQQPTQANDYFNPNLSSSSSSSSSAPSPSVHELSASSTYSSVAPPEPIHTKSSNKNQMYQGSPKQYTVLIISQNYYARVAIDHHIRLTAPVQIPITVSAAEDIATALKFLASGDFSHVVVNFSQAKDTVSIMEQLVEKSDTILLVITTPLQRSSILQLASDYEPRFSNRLHFLFKLVKPSKFSAVFDPCAQRDSSTDLKMKSANQVVASQRRVFEQMREKLNGKEFKVLLVEDNLVNQKVLLKFLDRVGMQVETANDGQECIEIFTCHPPNFFQLILCDLHMPRKDGFQACLEIREWEKKNLVPEYSPIPIVALSANVMSDVAERCAIAGFTSYISKPINFETLKGLFSEFTC